MFDHRGMGFNNPDVTLVGARAHPVRPPAPAVAPRPAGANGGDSPAWSPVRAAYVPPAHLERRTSSVPYAELHCHSHFSFLDGASSPEELAEEAARLGLESLALTDHDGFYGVVRFAEAARAVGVPTVFGAELSLGLTRPQNGTPGSRGHAPARRRPGTRRATPASRPRSARRSWRGPRRASRSTTTSPSPTSTATTGWCSPAAGRGRCRGRSWRTARPPPPASSTR